MKKISLLISVLAFALVSCNREDSHIVVPKIPEQDPGGVIVGLNTANVTTEKFEDTHLYCFDASQKMIRDKYYATQQDLARDLFTLESGAYTFVAVLNVGPSFSAVTTPDSTLSEVLDAVKQAEPAYPDMLTGMITRTIARKEVTRIEIPLSDRSEGLTMTAVAITITLPDAEFGEYQQARVRATEPHNLRGVAEFRQPGKPEVVRRLAQMLSPAPTPGCYLLTTEMPQGNYELLLWVDYTESGSAADLWYDTKYLQAVKLIANDKTYASGSDAREVFYGAAAVAASGPVADVRITTARPQAKYVLIADDVIRYRTLMVANPGKYVPLDELSIAISYEGYLPDGFNAQEGKPNSSQQGYKCEKAALPAVDKSDTEVKIGSDYVFVNGGESSVMVTVLVTDKSGRTVSRVTGVVIQYKRNMLTTVRGDFLTAGVVNPGINIDTDWDGVHNVEF